MNKNKKYLICSLEFRWKKLEKKNWHWSFLPVMDPYFHPLVYYIICIPHNVSISICFIRLKCGVEFSGIESFFWLWSFFPVALQMCKCYKCSFPVRNSCLWLETKYTRRKRIHILRHKFKIVYVFLYGHGPVHFEHGSEYIFGFWRSAVATRPCDVVVHARQEAIEGGKHVGHVERDRKHGHGFHQVTDCRVENSSHCRYVLSGNFKMITFYSAILLRLLTFV